MVEKSLYYYLSQIEDFRDNNQRHKLADVLSMIIMAILSGRKGTKSISRFIQTHKVELSKLFKTKHGVPSYGTLWTVLNQISFESMNAALFAWVQANAPLIAEDILSGDGKALRSTNESDADHTQRFVMLVSLYCARTNLVYSAHVNDSGKDREDDTIRTMYESISTLVKGISVSLDALHTQKKQ